MKKIILMFTLIFVTTKIFGYIEYGVGMGYANNLKIKNKVLYEGYDVNRFILEFDLRHGFQLGQESPFYLIYDLGIGFDRLNQGYSFIDEPFTINFANIRYSRKFDISTGIMFKPTKNAKVFATFGWAGMDNHRERVLKSNIPEDLTSKNTIEAYTLNLSGDIDLSNNNVVLLLGTNFTNFSWISQYDENFFFYYNTQNILDNIFEYSIRVGTNKVIDPKIYFMGVVSQSFSNHKTTYYTEKQNHVKYSRNEIYFGPELVVLPSPKLQLYGSYGFINSSLYGEPLPWWVVRPSDKIVHIYEVAVEYDMDFSSNWLIIGLKYINSSDYAFKHESMLYHEIFTYLRWENKQKRDNNRIPYLSSGMGANFLSSGIPSNGSILSDKSY